MVASKLNWRLHRFCDVCLQPESSSVRPASRQRSSELAKTLALRRVVRSPSLPPSVAHTSSISIF